METVGKAADGSVFWAGYLGSERLVTEAWGHWQRVVGSAVGIIQEGMEIGFQMQGGQTLAGLSFRG